MFVVGAFILYALILFITLFLLIDQEERRQILFPKQKLLFQFLWGVGLAGLFIAICAGINLGLSSGVAAFQFRTIEIKQMAAFIVFQLLVAVTEEVLFRGYLTILGRRLQLD
ncbi:MAG: CPBP family intramembrane metalloprotease, partial [Lachnospiraceae bacterium]|nr:CPBP family intramembrane metalloprotease [Lachnospiraceae bacterium]